jgi:anti-sigma B factor antagonist
MSLTIQTEATDAPRTARLALAGRLDSVTAPQLEKEVEPLLDGRYDFLVLDLARLTFISSAGIRVLVAARKSMRGQSGGVLMLNAQPQILKVFEIIKALPGLSVFANDAEMDEYLTAMQRRVLEK